MTVTRAHNLRDVGGLRTADGGVVRSGVLYRSETLERDAAAPDGLVWPPRTIVDLRLGEREHELAHTGAVIHRIPMAPWLDPEAMRRDEAAGHVDLPARYLRMIAVVADQVADLVRIVAESEGPVLVHCILGKDRTGIVVAILLRAVGVGRDEVMADYQDTHENLPALLDSLRDRGQRLPEDQSLLETCPPALDGVLDILDGESGSPTDWLVQRGVDVRSLQQLRRRLVDGGYVVNDRGRRQPLAS